jgi:hypothetical protein
MASSDPAHSTRKRLQESQTPLDADPPAKKKLRSGNVRTHASVDPDKHLREELSAIVLEGLQQALLPELAGIVADYMHPILKGVAHVPPTWIVRVEHPFPSLPLGGSATTLRIPQPEDDAGVYSLELSSILPDGTVPVFLCPMEFLFEEDDTPHLVSSTLLFIVWPDGEHQFDSLAFPLLEVFDMANSPMKIVGRAKVAYVPSHMVYAPESATLFLTDNHRHCSINLGSETKQTEFSLARTDVRDLGNSSLYDFHCGCSSAMAYDPHFSLLYILILRVCGKFGDIHRYDTSQATWLDPLKLALPAENVDERCQMVVYGSDVVISFRHAATSVKSRKSALLAFNTTTGKMTRDLGVIIDALPLVYDFLSYSMYELHASRYNVAVTIGRRERRTPVVVFIT